MPVRLFIVALALPAVAAAQTTEFHPRSITTSVGIGSGIATFTCDQCALQSDVGVTLAARAAVAVRTNTLVGLDVTGWIANSKDSRGTATTGIVFVNATAQWYPRKGSGLFAKAGAGVALIRDEIKISGIGSTTVTATAPSFVVGAGWDLPTTRSWRLAPYVDFNFATNTDISLNSQQSRNQLGASLLHVGLAVTW